MDEILAEGVAASGSQAYLMIAQTDNALIFAFFGQVAAETGLLLVTMSAGPS